MKERRDVFFAIADENRRAILEKLAVEKDSLSVGTIANDFKVSRNAISKHIIVLKESGLVTTQYLGRENMVSLDALKLAEVYTWIYIFEEFWGEKLNKLKKLVESKNQKK
jgi:DNA-binding transcriptional ArsR family regulator